MSKNSLYETITNGVLFTYIFSLYFFTQIEGLFIYSNILALLFMILVVFKIISKKKILFNKYLILFFLFVIVSFLSIIVSINSQLSFSKSITLLSLFALSVSIVNHIDSIKKIMYVIIAFFVSGLIMSVYMFVNTDFAVLNRAGSEFGNVNSIGIALVVSLSSGIFLSQKFKKPIFLFLNVPIITGILLTGSRKAAILVIIQLLFMVIAYNKNKFSISRVVWTTIFTISFAYVLYYLVMNNNVLYSILGERIENMFLFIKNEGGDRSIMNRNLMIQSGIDFFKKRPLLGYGADNFRELMGINYSMYTYSHNNVIELLVGMGIVGTFIYYLLQIVALRKLIKMRKLNAPLIYMFISLIIGYLIMSVGLVYYEDKIVTVILSLSSVIPIITIKSKLINNDIKDGKIL